MWKHVHMTGKNLLEERKGDTAFTEDVSEKCKKCGSDEFLGGTFTTERVAYELQKDGETLGPILPDETPGW